MRADQIKEGMLVDLDPVIDVYGPIGHNDVASMFEYATVEEDATPCEDTPGGVWLHTDLGSYVLPAEFEVPIEEPARPIMGQKERS